VRRAETFRAIRALPKERRRELTRAVRAGRAVEDPRDRALAAEWARTFTDAWWPRWLLPRERPSGRGRVLWLLHAAWLLATFIFVAVGFAASSHGSWRWIVVALLVYALVAVPPLLWFTLRVRWNAPEAERLNR
jgi:MFS family permease